MISCPTCRKTFQLPDMGAGTFPSAFFVNSILDIQADLQTSFTKVSEGTKMSCDNCQKPASSYCIQCTRFLCLECIHKHNGWQPFTSHELVDPQNVPLTSPRSLEKNLNCIEHDQPLNVFCETCQEFICRDCTISENHENHNYKLVTESYSKHRQEIEANLQIIKEKLADTTTALIKLTTREKEVTKQGKDVKKEIHIQAQLVVDLVQESERQLAAKVENAVQKKIELLTKQKEEVEAALHQLKECEEFVEQMLKVGTQYQILRENQNVERKMQSLNQQINPTVFKPIEEANISFTRNIMEDKYRDIGMLNYQNFGEAILTKQDSFVGKKSIITLAFQSHNGTPFTVPSSIISCEFSYCGDSKHIACDINQTQPGKYEVGFTLHTVGKHQVAVQLGGVNISRIVFVTNPLEANVIRGLSTPWGAAVTKHGEIIVAEKDAHRITILDKNGKQIRSFGTQGAKVYQLTNPRGVAISHDGYILVTDEHRLHKLTFEGDCVKSLGSQKKGSGQLQFHYPAGITIHPITGQIFVADYKNHRIQVFNNNLTFCSSFGKKGAEQLKGPVDVAIDNYGFLYVVDFDNNCIKKFNLRGQYISTLGSRGSNPCQLDMPTSIAINNDLVYVSQCSGNPISIFNTDGHFIRTSGTNGRGDKDFNNPRYITVDSFGKLYVSDTHNNKLVIL